MFSQVCHLQIQHTLVFQTAADTQAIYGRMPTSFETHSKSAPAHSSSARIVSNCFSSDATSADTQPCSRLQHICTHSQVTVGGTVKICLPIHFALLEIHVDAPLGLCEADVIEGFADGWQTYNSMYSLNVPVSVICACLTSCISVCGCISVCVTVAACQVALMLPAQSQRQRTRFPRMHSCGISVLYQ